MKHVVVAIHTALWLVLAFNTFWMGWDNYVPRFGLSYLIIKTVIITAIHMSIFYINYFWMVPILLYRRKWWLYGVLVVAMIVLSNAGSWGMFTLLSRFYDHQLAPFDFTYGFYFSLNGLTFLLLSGLAWFTWYGIKESKRSQMLEKEKVRAELQALAGKVNPHFLFNTLNNIYVLVRQKHEGAEQAILDLSGLMRYMLERSDADLVPLVDEIKMMKDYIALQKIRLEPGYRLQVNFPDQINSKIRVPPLLFIPVLENVFKHGDLSTEGFVSLNLYLNEVGICWESKNAIDDSQPKNGAGLMNLRERLKLLYGDGYLLETNRVDDVFETKMCICL